MSTVAVAAVGVVSAALGSVGAYFTWKSSGVRQRRLAAADVAAESAATEAKKTEIREAVYRNDDAKLNQIVTQLMKD